MHTNQKWHVVTINNIMLKPCGNIMLKNAQFTFEHWDPTATPAITNDIKIRYAFLQLCTD